MIMGKIVSIGKEKCNGTASRAAMRARKLMCKDISRHLVLKELARSVGTNECALKREFKYLFNTSVYQYLLFERMKRARRLLVNTGMPVKCIAYNCGFESLAGFINTFRRLYHLSPGAFRKQQMNPKTDNQIIHNDCTCPTPIMI